MNIFMLIDRSGSMAVRWLETITSINAYVENLSLQKGMKKARVTVATFDSPGREISFEVIRDKIPLKEWSDITDKDARPRGGTPLHDAIGLFAGLVNKKEKRAVVAIMTDGKENSSMEVTRDGAKRILDELRERGFDIVFLGADFDAFGQGMSLGNNAGQTLNMTKGNYKTAMGDLAVRTASYASTGKVEGFSDDVRKRASGQ